MLLALTGRARIVTGRRGARGRDAEGRALPALRRALLLGPCGAAGSSFHFQSIEGADFAQMCSKHSGRVRQFLS